MIFYCLFQISIFRLRGKDFLGSILNCVVRVAVEKFIRLNHLSTCCKNSLLNNKKTQPKEVEKENFLEKKKKKQRVNGNSEKSFVYFELLLININITDKKRKGI